MANPRLQPDTNPMPFDGTRRSKKYRDRAEECRRLAKMATDDELKASYQALPNLTTRWQRKLTTLNNRALRKRSHFNPMPLSFPHST
jgi:hypothetical protein